MWFGKVVTEPVDVKNLERKRRLRPSTLTKWYREIKKRCYSDEFLLLTGT